MGRRLLNSFFQSWQISLSAVRQQEVDENELSLDESMALRKKQVRDRPGSAHENGFLVVYWQGGEVPGGRAGRCSTI